MITTDEAKNALTALNRRYAAVWGLGVSDVATAFVCKDVFTVTTSKIQGAGDLVSALTADVFLVEVDVLDDDRAGLLTDFIKTMMFLRDMQDQGPTIIFVVPNRFGGDQTIRFPTPLANRLIHLEVAA